MIPLPWIVLACASATAAYRIERSSAFAWPPQIRGRVHGPSWPDFANETERWSTYAAPTFDLVFIPESEEDLSLGLRYMSSHNLTWLARSGGHGYSTTLETVQDAVLINMQNFNYTTVNADNTVTTGSGSSFQDLTVPVSAAGRELTIGSCPCVGATGAMLGGGVGRLQGLHGLTSDAVLALRIALWNGTIIDVSAGSHPDLFWGMRGAGQNFGVVIETTFQTFPQSNGGVHYNADMTFGANAVVPVINAINALYPVDPALALVILYATNPETLEPYIAINLVYAGPESEGRRFTERFSNYSLTLNESMIAWEDLAFQAAGGAVAARCVDGLSHDTHDSVTVDVNLDTFSDLFTSYGAVVAANPGLFDTIVLLEVFPQQGINAHPVNFSAFPHRGQFNTLVAIEMTYSDSSLETVADDWGRRWRDTLSSPAVSGYPRMVQYQNYAHGDEPLSALYGYEEWRHRRLTGLKQRYDPHGFFNGYHAVPEKLEDWN